MDKRQVLTELFGFGSDTVPVSTLIPQELHDITLYNKKQYIIQMRQTYDMRFDDYKIDFRREFIHIMDMMQEVHEELIKIIKNEITKYPDQEFLKVALRIAKLFLKLHKDTLEFIKKNKMIPFLTMYNEYNQSLKFMFYNQTDKKVYDVNMLMLFEEIYYFALFTEIAKYPNICKYEDGSKINANDHKIPYLKWAELYENNNLNFENFKIVSVDDIKNIKNRLNKSMAKNNIKASAPKINKFKKFMQSILKKFKK